MHLNGWTHDDGRVDAGTTVVLWPYGCMMLVAEEKEMAGGCSGELPAAGVLAKVSFSLIIFW